MCLLERDKVSLRVECGILLDVWVLFGIGGDIIRRECKEYLREESVCEVL